MPLVNKQPFKPNPIPDNLNSNDEVFYHELTNEIFTSHDDYFDRFLYCNSLIWTCSRTKKSGLTYKEALDSERSLGSNNGGAGDSPKKKRKRASNSEPSSKGSKKSKPSSPGDAGDEKQPKKRAKTSTDKGKNTSDDQSKETKDVSEDGEPSETSQPNGDGSTTGEPIKKKKKKYPYDPKKYSMPVPEGFDPNLLTPTGKIDGRKLKSKKNKTLAEMLLLESGYQEKPLSPTKGKKGKAKQDEARRKEEEARKKEEEIKKKALMQAELAKERELEAKRKKEAATLAKQLERQKKEEERKRAALFLQNWEKKCEDLERDDLKRLPQPTPVNCDIPERLFGDSVFIMEAVYVFYDLYKFNEIYPEGLGFDTLEEILLEKHEDGALGALLIFLLRTIFDTQPTQDGYGLDDDSTLLAQADSANSTSDAKDGNSKIQTEVNGVDTESNGIEHEEVEEEENEDDNDENNEKYVNMNDRIGSAIKAAQEVKKTFSKPLPDMDLNASNVTEILRLHLLQSGSFPKGRTIYNGWYSSREDPGLWLCMEEPDLMKKLGEVTVYDLEIEERIKILHTLIYQLLTFIKSRSFMELASDQLLELRKQYRKEAADFARWDRENCVKRMQPPKRKDQQPGSGMGGNTCGPGHDEANAEIKSETHEPNHHNYPNSNQPSECGDDGDEESSNQQQQRLKSCLKSNGTSDPQMAQDNNDSSAKSKKITFKGAVNGVVKNEASGQDDEVNSTTTNGDQNSDQIEQSYEELERAYEQNKVDYEDFQRERAIRAEQLNETLLTLRTELRNNQSLYAIHPIGRDRSYRRYWLFQSLPGLFIEQDDEYIGECLPQPTPLESRYKKLFGKDNPLMHPNEADLIRTKTCDVACSTDSNDGGPSNTTTTTTTTQPKSEATIKVEHDHGDATIKDETHNGEEDEVDEDNAQTLRNNNNNNKCADVKSEIQLPNGGDHAVDGASEHDADHLASDTSLGLISDEMNYCTGDKASCCVHGPKRLSNRWWFYHTPDSIDKLIECLNKRGYRESELHDVLSAESSIIKPRAADCPSHKLNKLILEQSGIRRSRRLRTKTGKRKKGRKVEYE